MLKHLFDFLYSFIFLSTISAFNDLNFSYSLNFLSIEKFSYKFNLSNKIPFYKKHPSINKR